MRNDLFLNWLKFFTPIYIEKLFLHDFFLKLIYIETLIRGHRIRGLRVPSIHEAGWSTSGDLPQSRRGGGPPPNSMHFGPWYKFFKVIFAFYSQWKRNHSPKLLHGERECFIHLCKGSWLPLTRRLDTVPNIPSFCRILSRTLSTRATFPVPRIATVPVLDHVVSSDCCRFLQPSNRIYVCTIQTTQHYVPFRRRTNLNKRNFGIYSKLQNVMQIFVPIASVLRLCGPTIHFIYSWFI